MLWRMRVLLRLVRGALLGAFHDNAFATAKAATYSFLLSVFPALLLLTNILAGFHFAPSGALSLTPILSRVLPSPALALMQSSLAGVTRPSTHVVVSAALVALWTGSSVVTSWMDGFQKAYGTPAFTLVRQRVIAMLLAVALVIPLLLATLLVSIGGSVERWLAGAYGMWSTPLLLMWDVTRWLIAIATTTLILSVIYHAGVRRTLSWNSVFPGAFVATLLWLPSTVAFAVYVRHTEYSNLYGSIAAVVVLMVWMYILSLAVLVGAEFNSELELHRFSKALAQSR